MLLRAFSGLLRAFDRQNYAECAEVIKRYCEEAGLKVEIFDSKHDGIPRNDVIHVIVTRQGRGGNHRQ